MVSVPVWGVSFVSGSIPLDGTAGAPGTGLEMFSKFCSVFYLSVAEEVVHLYLKYETVTCIFVLACLTVVNSVVNSHMLNGCFCRK